MGTEPECRHLVGEYLRNALAYARTHQRRDFMAGNEFADRMWSLAKQLRHDFGAEGREALAELMDHEDLVVRISTASICLDFAEQKAKAVLEEASKTAGLSAFEAGVALNEWNEGAKRFP